MTTLPALATAPAGPTGGRPTAARRTASAEWLKLRSLRSTRWSLAALVVVSVGLTIAMTAWLASQWDTMSTADRLDYTTDPVGFLGAALGLAQLAVCVLGVLAVSGEYASGAMRSSVLAVPDRRLLLLTKAAVLAGTTLVVGEVLGFACFLVSRPALTGRVDASLTDPEVLRAVVGVGVYLCLLSLLAFAIGAIVRHTAAAVTAVIGVVLVVAQLAYLVPGSAGDHIAAALPSNAGMRITQIGSDTSVLSPWQGLAVLVLWVVALLGTAAWLAERRDV